jgi:hypothetical protein
MYFTDYTRGGEEVGPPGIEFRNDNANGVPPFGILRVTGTTILANREILTCDQPNAYGSTYLHFINGPATVASGKTGKCFNGFPVSAAFDIGDGTPAFGSMWGPRNGTWLLKKNTHGFRVVGLPDQVNGVVSVIREPMLTVRGTIAADAGPDTNSTLTVYTGAYGSEVTTSQTISNVRNSSDCTLKSGGGAKIHTAFYTPDNGTWQFDVGRTV